MLQQDTPSDFVISTGVQYSVREFVEKLLVFLVPRSDGRIQVLTRLVTS